MIKIKCKTTKPTELEILIHQAKMFGKLPGMIHSPQTNYIRRIHETKSSK